MRTRDSVLKRFTSNLRLLLHFLISTPLSLISSHSFLYYPPSSPSLHPQDHHFYHSYTFYQCYHHSLSSLFTIFLYHLSFLSLSNHHSLSLFIIFLYHCSLLLFFIIIIFVLFFTSIFIVFLYHHLLSSFFVIIIILDHLCLVFLSIIIFNHHSLSSFFIFLVISLIFHSHSSFSVFVLIILIVHPSHSHPHWFLCEAPAGLFLQCSSSPCSRSEKVEVIPKPRLHPEALRVRDRRGRGRSELMN